MITGTAFVDLSAAYDTGNQGIQELYNASKDSTCCRVIQNLLPNGIFYVELIQINFFTAHSM